MAKLDPAFKAKWVAALRSGEYPQAKQRLRTVDGYCCLGVGCAVSGHEDLVSLNGPVYNMYPTVDVCEEWGMDHDTMVRLGRFNDIEDWTLEQIADWVEENL